MKLSSVPSIVRVEWFLILSVATCLVFLIFGNRPLGRLDQPLHLSLAFAWLFFVILGAALAVVRHADQLGERLGEPYGTLILTLSITSIEVISITAIMLHGANNPTLARDTLFAVTMIILNGMVGLSLLMGGWRHREQHYNLQGANAYLGVVIPLGILALVLPNFTVTTSGPTLSFAQESFVAIVSVVLYVAFLALQTKRHRAYFAGTEHREGESSVAASIPSTRLLTHVVLLVVYMAQVVFLAEKLAQPMDYVVETMKWPAALAGLAMAVLVATPEALGAIRAARANHMQRSVNIFLGSVLSTIGLTIPLILVISHVTQHPIVLGLEHTDLLLFVLTLALCLVTFSSGHTNVLQGGVHLILFATYLFFIFQG
jgi:Ca2+:H+ antiporter